MSELYDKSPYPRLIVHAIAVHVEIVSEPYVILTRLGYAPMVDVTLEDGSKHGLIISSATLTTGLEKLRKANGGKLSGIKALLRKESEDPKSKYIVEAI
jgi:hypothetical protein